MGGDASDVLSETFSLVEVDFDGGSSETTDQGSWIPVIQDLLRRFLTDEVLRKVHDAVEIAE